MQTLMIRRAQESDIPAINSLLYQVHEIHHIARPDLFRDGTKKYTDDELKIILQDDTKPIFVAEQNGAVVGYAFCIHQQYVNDNNLTDIKTLYIDDLCVDKNARNMHIGTELYNYVLKYAEENGYYNVTLNVWADNINAVKFYEHLGLSKQKIGMEKIILRK